MPRPGVIGGYDRGFYECGRDRCGTRAVAGTFAAGLGCGQDVLVGGLPLRRYAGARRLSARGPDDIVKRLKMGLEPLAGYENHDGLLLSNGSDVMYEHSETWTFETGEQGVLRFVTVHQGGGRENHGLERLLGHEQPRQLRAAQPLREPGKWGYELGI